MSVQNLVQVMQAQTVLMNELAALEKRMLSAILAKNAAGIQACVEQNDALSAHLEQAETVRIAIIGNLATSYGIVSHPDSDCRSLELFDRVVLRLDAKSQAQVKDTIKLFRVAVQNLVNMNQALRMYTEAQLVTLDSFLCELLPQRNHGVYGADGKQSASARPQLLNRQA